MMASCHVCGTQVHLIVEVVMVVAARRSANMHVFSLRVVHAQACSQECSLSSESFLYNTTACVVNTCMHAVRLDVQVCWNDRMYMVVMSALSTTATHHTAIHHRHAAMQQYCVPWSPSSDACCNKPHPHPHHPSHRAPSFQTQYATLVASSSSCAPSLRFLLSPPSQSSS